MPRGSRVSAISCAPHAHGLECLFVSGTFLQPVSFMPKTCVTWVMIIDFDLVTWMDSDFCFS